MTGFNTRLVSIEKRTPDKAVFPYHRAMHLITAAFLATLGLVFTSGQVALAHNSLVTSSPSNGETLAISPAVWSVEYEKVVPLSSASGELITSDGVRTEIIARHGASENILLFDLPPQLLGSVTTRWRLVGQDGHVISGRVSFTVASNSPAQPATVESVLPQPTAASDETISEEGFATSDFLALLTRFGTFFAVVLLAGLLFAELYVARGAAVTTPGRRVLQTTTISLAILPVIALVLVVSEIQYGTESYASAMSTLLSLSIGPMLLVRIVIGVLLAVVVISHARQTVLSNQALAQLSALIVMFSVTLAYSGHSRSQALPWLGVPTDVLHMLAISVWLGGLIALVLLIIPNVSIEQGMAAYRRFGYAAERAVPLILVTGIIQTLRLHGDINSLFTSSHGLWLLLKISFVSVMLLIGNRNRKLLNRRMTAIDSKIPFTRATLIRASVVEAFCGVAIISVSAVLVVASLT